MFAPLNFKEDNVLSYPSNRHKKKQYIPKSSILSHRPKEKNFSSIDDDILKSNSKPLKITPLIPSKGQETIKSNLEYTSFRSSIIDSNLERPNCWTLRMTSSIPNSNSQNELILRDSKSNSIPTSQNIHLPPKTHWQLTPEQLEWTGPFTYIPLCSTLKTYNPSPEKWIKNFFTVEFTYDSGPNVTILGNAEPYSFVLFNPLLFSYCTFTSKLSSFNPLLQPLTQLDPVTENLINFHIEI